MSEYVLEIREVTKSYGDFTAIKNINFSVPEGKVYGLLGPNGAGKTTLIRIINQIIMPDKGEILFRGNPITRKDIERIGYLPEERGLYKKMKVGEQLLYLAQLKGLSKREAKEKIGNWLQEFEITDWWDRKVESLSKGMAQKLQFIATIVHEPKFLILDEPFSGFDPVNAEVIKDKIAELRDQGTTVLLSSHRMDNVEALCDSLALINHSEIVMDGTLNSIKEINKTNQYLLKFRGKLSSNELNVQAPFKVLEENFKEEINRSEVLIQLENEDDFKALAIELLNQYDLVSAEERLPSIKDIFINTVKGNNHE